MKIKENIFFKMQKLTHYDILINNELNKVIKFGIESNIMREYNNILSLPNSDFYYKDVEVSGLSFDLKEYLNEHEFRSLDNYTKLSNEKIIELHMCFVKGKTFNQIYEEHKTSNKTSNKLIIEKTYFFIILKALLELYFKVKDLNSKLFFHNDINGNNIIFDSDKFILIDFGEMTIINPDCIECDSDSAAIIQHINDLFGIGKFNISVQKWLLDNNLLFHINEESVPLLYQLLLNPIK